MTNAKHDDNWVPTLLGVSTVDGKTPIPAEINPTTGGLLVQEVGSIVSESYDYLSLSQGSTTDVWTYKTGGSGGTTVGTVTITYTDSSKAIISSVART